VIGLPQDVPGYKPIDVNRREQIHLLSEDEKRLIRYTKMEPRKGLKTFYGYGVLEMIDGVNAPFFQITGKSNMFVGFFDDRLFRIEIVNWGEDPARVRREVSALGLEVLTRATAASKRRAH
jgi:hypothetical protein